MRRGLHLAVLVLLSTTLMGAVPATAFATRTLGISQGTFTISLPPGGTYSGEFVAENAGTEALGRVYVYTTDITFDDKGNVVYTPVTKDIAATPAKLRKSAAAWTQLKLPATTVTDYNAAYVALEPGQKIPVAFTIRVPQNAAPGDYGEAIFLEMSSQDTTAAAGTGSVVAGRIGTRIRLRVTGTVKTDFRFGFQSVTSTSLGQASGGLMFGQNFPIDLRFENKGNVDVQMSADLTLRSGGRVEQSFAMGNFESFYLPAENTMDDTRILTIASWWPGPRTIVYHVSYYDESLQRQVDDQRSIDVFFVPWQFLAMLGVVLVLLSGGLLFRSYRKTGKGKRTAVAAPVRLGTERERVSDWGTDRDDGTPSA